MILPYMSPSSSDNSVFTFAEFVNVSERYFYLLRIRSLLNYRGTEIRQVKPAYVEAKLGCRPALIVCYLGLARVVC
jgi:hypothetical protein